MALIAACGVPLAQAQTGFQGTPTVQGSANPDLSTPGTVVLRDTETVINWRPTDTSGTGVIDFLPAGQTQTFTNEVSGVSDFTVLNRILPVDGSGLPVSRIVAFNGTVQSQINGSTGGKVWFYAPGGIIAGPGAVFDVGSLVLTSSDIDSTNGLGGTIHFLPSQSTAAVEIKPTARISALTSGSYVALVAPRVVQGGTVQVNGSTAYVAAEAADITINGGLFDISISAGTTDANGVVHTGDTERPGATVTDAQHVFMVAVPKNNALTMLLSGNVGYDAANSAVQTNSGVVLSAGYDVTGGSIGARNATATGEANISIGGGAWQPDVSGQASGEIVIRSSAAPATSFAANVTLAADRAITLRADQGGSIGVGGNLDLSAGTGGTGGKIDVLTYGGSATAAGNGQISVTGSMGLDASAFGAGTSSFNAQVLAGGSATGGQINVIANGGSISAADLTANARASSGGGSDSSGDATGGAITVSALTAAGPSGALGGTISFGSMSLIASANVGYDFYFGTVSGGKATAGTIGVSAAGGSIAADDISLFASGFGGDATGVAGTGTGGSISLSSSMASGPRGNLAVAGCSNQCFIRAEGSGGYGANGANATGGTIQLDATDADFSIGGSLYLQAGAIGGGANGGGTAGRGGDGLGGLIAVESRAGAASSADMRFGAIIATADGGSAQNVEGLYFNQGDSGNGVGGSVNFLVAGGSFTADSLLANAFGQGGTSDINCPSCGDGVTPYQSGIGQGGTAQFLITGGSATIPSLTLAADGIGGGASAANAADEVSSIAGRGIGGTALLESRGGVLNADGVTIEANGAGGAGLSGNFNGPNGGNGGAGAGGSAGLLMAVGGIGQINISEGVSIQAQGLGGAGGSVITDFSSGQYVAGVGGGGSGGTADLTLASGTLNAPSLTVSAEGVGGDGGNNDSDGPGGAAGNGVGGTARAAYLNEGHSIGALMVKADGQGGLAGINGAYDSINKTYVFGSGQGGAGGAGQGGSANLLIDVDPSFASLIVSADGFGSAGAVSGTGGAGGVGTGGVAALNIAFGATSVSDELRVSASGVGGVGGAGLTGAGGRGGDAFGGSATLGLSGASTSLDAGNIAVLAEALGGAGGLAGPQGGLGVAGADGGNALGGTALFAVSAGANAITGATLTLSGDATGGAGSVGQDGPAAGAGGNGGQATGGAATLRIDGGRLRVNSSFSTLPPYSITATGQGGAGANGGVAFSTGAAGIGGNGGSGAGGTASFEATDADFVLGDLSIVADGLAGLGGAGGVAGPTSGGTARLTNGGGAVLGAGAQRLLASLSMTANGDAGGRISFADSSSAAGGGLRIAGPMTLSASGTVVPGFTGISFAASGNPVTVGGTADFTTQGPLSFAFDGGGALAVAGALTGYSGTGVTITHGARPAGLDSIAADSILLTTAGGISVTGGALRSAGLLTMLARGGDIALSGGSALVAGGDLRLFAQGSVNGAGGAASAGGRAAIGLGGAGNISLASLSSGGLLDMADASGNALGGTGIAIGGDFAVSGALTIGAGGGTLSAATIGIGTLTADSQALTAPGGVQIGNAVMTGDLIVNGSLQLGGADIGGLLQQRGATAAFGGSVAAGAIDVDAGSVSANGLNARTGDLLLRSVAGLSVTDALAAGNVSLTSTSGGLTIGNAVAGGALTLSGIGISAQGLGSGGAALLNAGAGDLTVSNIAAGPITALGRNISLGSSGAMTIANAVASGGNALLNAAGLVAVTGRVSGQAVTIGSSDIVIGPNGRVDAAGLLRFDALGGAAIGGGDATAGYSLSAAELGRVSAGDIAISAGGDVIVRDLTIGTGVLAGGGVLTIGTPGLLRVQGAVALTGRSGQGGLTLSGGQAVQVIAGQGSIDISDANGALGGVLSIDAPVIYAATLAAIGDVQAAGSLGARDLRLAQSDGLALDAGMLRAGAIGLAASQGVYIQNSGISTSFADRRGFTANSLTVLSGTERPQIAINGRLAIGGGLFATGLDTIPLVAINGRYAAGSKINGCFIGAGPSCTGISIDNRETLNGLLDPTASLARIFPLALIQLRDIVTQGYPPLIDEPVTGAGNEDLWDRPCGEPGEEACPAQ